MIRFSLTCAQHHAFEAWFASSDGFEDQRSNELVACPVCGSTQVEKALMAPRVATARQHANAREEAAREVVETLRAVREHITANATDVGKDFPDEARKIHYGETQPKHIYGSAKREDVEDLLEEGIEISPLPVLPEDAN